MVYLQVPQLGGSCDKIWHGQGIWKCSVSWNLPKLSQLRSCNRGFRLCTTQNHLRTKQFVSGTWNFSTVAACALRNEQAGRGHWPRLSGMCEKHLSGARYVTKGGYIKRSKVGQKFGVCLPLLTCSPSVWPSQLLYRRGRKSKRDLRITLYNLQWVNGKALFHIPRSTHVHPCHPNRKTLSHSGHWNCIVLWPRQKTSIEKPVS
jgi:hypothetical protein